MRLLADESCTGPVIRALRSAGHDLVAIAEEAKGTGDENVMQRAFREQRVLVTEDTDFGELTYARGQPSAGVLLVRFHRRTRRAKPAAVVEAIEKLGDRLSRSFAVVEPGRVRVARRPPYPPSD